MNALKAGGAYVTPTLIVFETIAKYLDDASLAALYDAPETAYVSAYWRRNMSAERNFFRQSFGENYATQIKGLNEQSVQHRTLTRQLNDAGVPLLLGTSVGMDKDVMKRLLRDGGLPIGRFIVLHKHEKRIPLSRLKKDLRLPIFIKPAI